MRISLLAALPLAGCGSGLEPPKPEPTFDPIAFFDGRTRSEGVIDPLLGGDRRLRVDSVGYADRGGLLLIQRIEEGSKPARIRRWRMKPIARGRYGGWLTDAEGRIEATSAGNRLTIRYATPGGFDVEQWLTLQPDRRTVDNRMAIRKWGVRVASVDETIRKLD